jgi:HEPN domain-containing protein
MSADQAPALTWLEFANADLAMAKIPLPDGAVYEQLCFHAQQAAEKAIKGVLIHSDLDFPFVHDLRLLANLLPASLRSTAELSGIDKLTPYAVATRYPFSFRDNAVDKSEYEEAIRIADRVVAWAEGAIAQPRE